ncbi:MAG: class I SAM-dependent methyltransferase [Candidatus Peribacteraceae bacterium]|jgi:ubiquinone/menaquinone biosynthesis C-methylase UbiE
MQFTGECYVPGQTSDRIREDTLARYRFAQAFVRGKDVLDIACATGTGTLSLWEAGARSVVGMDVSDEALAYANAHCSAPGVQYRKGDLQELPYEFAFDVIACFETIEHVPRYREALRRLHRALRPEGVLLLSTPHRRMTSPAARRLADPPLNPFHAREFTPPEMRDLLCESGFRPETLSLFGQRQQLYIPSKLLRYLYKRFRDPDHRRSAAFEPLKPFLYPRDILFVARRSASPA